MSQAKPCPKCGSMDIGFSSDYCKNECRNLFISCGNCDFGIKEGEHYEFDDEGNSTKFDAKAKLIEQWNLL